MPRAVPYPIRQEIVARHQTGESLTAVAQSLAMSYRTTRAIWSRYRKRGLEGLGADYEHCGLRGPRFPAAMHEAALSLKRAHPRWGAVLVKIQLDTQFSGEPLPSKRTLQVWFHEANLQRPYTRRPSAPRERSRRAHEVWQLDGKEEIPHADGTRSTAVSLVDEGTGTALGTALFPPAQVYPGSSGSGPSQPEALLRALGTSGRAARG